MTQLTKANLATQVTTLAADNTAGDISASDIRSLFTDTAESLVGGPTVATDNAVVRFDATTGQLVQNSVVIIADTTGNMSGVGTLACGTATITGAATVSTTLGVTGIATFADDIIGGASSDIAINTNKFTVAAATGNTLVAGTLAVTGAATLSSTLAAGATTVTGAASATTTVTAGTYFLGSVGDALTAAGTTRADALQLAKEINNVTTAAASTGVILPVGVVGMRITIFNAGANAIKVYASASETIDTVAGATGVTLTNAKRADYFFTAANTWISSQLGVISA